MKINWYKFTLSNGQDISEVCELQDKITQRFPLAAKGASISCETKNNTDIVEAVHEIFENQNPTYFFSINSEYALFAELILKMYSATACEKPQKTYHIWGDTNSPYY